MTDQNFNASANFTPLITAINAASDAWARYALEQNNSVATTKRYIKEIEEAAKKLNTSVGRAGDVLNKFADAQTRVNASVAGFDGSKIKVQIDDIRARTASAATQFNSFSKILGKAIPFTAGSLIASGIRQIISGFKEATDTMIEFEQGISLIRSISQDVQVDFNVLSEGLKKVSNEFNLPLLDATQAAYLAVSNQVVRGAESLDFLSTAAKLAKVANGSLTESVNAISSVLKSYNLDATEAERVSAVLFRTADLGRVSLKAIASQLGTVTILASQLAIPIEEVGAALATFTVRGVTEANALTFLRNIMIKILQPTEAMKEAVSKLGFESAETAVKSLGLFKFMEQLLSVTNGSNAEIAELFNSIRALQPALLFASSGAADFNKNLEALKNSTDGFNRAVDITRESAGFKLAQFFNTVKNEFVGLVETIVNGSVSIGRSLGEAFSGKNLRNTFGFSSAKEIISREFDTIDVESIRLKKTLTDLENKFKDVGSASAVAGAEYRRQFGSIEVEKQLVKDAIALDKLNRAQDDLINKRINESNRFIKRTEEGIDNLSRKLQKLAEEEADNFSNSLTGQDKIDNIRKQIERVISERNRLVENAKATGDTSLVVGSFDAERDKIKALIKFYQDEFKDSKVGKESVSALQVSLSLLAKQERQTITELQKQLQRDAEAGIKRRGELERQLIAQNAIAKSKADFDIKKIASAKDEETIRAEIEARKNIFAQNAGDLNPIDFKREQDILIKQVEFASNKILEIRQLAAEQAEKIALESLQKEAKAQEDAIKRYIENRTFAINKVKELTELGDNLLNNLTGDRRPVVRDINERVKSTSFNDPKLDDLVKELIKEINASRGLATEERIDKVLTGVPGNFISRVNDPSSPGFINVEEAKATLEGINITLKTYSSAVEKQAEVIDSVTKTINDIERDFISKSLLNKFLIDNSGAGLKDIKSSLLSGTENITPIGGDPNVPVTARAEAKERIVKEEVNIWEDAVGAMTRIWQNAVSNIPNVDFDAAKQAQLNEKEKQKADEIKRNYFDQSAKDTQEGAFNWFENLQRRRNNGTLETKADFDKRTESARNVGQSFIKAADAVDEFAGIMKATNVTARQRIGGILQSIGGVLMSIPTPYTQVAGGVLSAGGGLLSSRNFQNGGIVYRANGGDLGQASRGTDTIHAGLTQGEFVMNRMATDKFYPQLRAMNSWKGYASGGRVSTSTVNVGDINLNAPISNGQIDTVRLGNDLRNKIRNGRLGNLG